MGLHGHESWDPGGWKGIHVRRQKYKRGGEVCLRRTTKSVNDITHWAQFGSSSAVLGRLGFGVGPGKGGGVPY